MTHRLAVFAAAILALAALPAAAAPRIGQPAPELVMTQLDGATFNLGTQRGKVVVLSLWATWCAPCREEMPILNGLYQAHRSQGLVVEGMSADRLRSRGDVARDMEPFVYASGMALDAKTNGFGVPRILPQTFVIDRQGVVRAVFGVLGQPVSQTGLEAAVAPLLAEPPAGDP